MWELGCGDGADDQRVVASPQVYNAVVSLERVCFIDEQPTPSAVAALQRDIRTLIRAFRREPDRRFRMDTSDPDTTSMRELLEGYPREFAGTPCSRHIPAIRRALRAGR